MKRPESNVENGAARSLRVFLCECGPIIKDAIDLERLADRLTALPEVDEVLRHPTLCSEEGRAWMAEDLAAHPGCRVVVAGCSPREHESTFRKVCSRGNVNPYLLAIANIREQCTWVTADRSEAEKKALAIIRASIARVLVQEPLDERDIDSNCDVLVLGAGVAGLTAAQMLARAGRRVCLVERAAAVGGRAALLGDVFPNMECASCLLEELMDDVLHDPQIELFSYSELVEVLGYFGNFTVRIRKRARHVNLDNCYGCRTCHEACPREVPNEFDLGLSSRKAIYIPYEGALPNATLIDESSCAHFQGESCDACAAACPFGNIDLGAQDEIVERHVGAIIVATGAEPRLPDAPYPPERVISSLALERLLSSAGPTRGALRLPGLEPPRTIALVECADQNGRAPSTSCSKICCMAFAKYTRQIRDRLAGCEIYQIGWDRCLGGKGFREFGASAAQIQGLHRIQLDATDCVNGFREDGKRTLIDITRDGQRVVLAADLVVVSPLLAGAAGVERLGSILRIDLDEHGFVVEENERLRPFCTPVEGVLVAGGARGPGDIQESAAQGAAAAGNVLAALVPGRRLRVEPATAIVDRDLCGGCHTCVVACPYAAVSFDDDQGVAEVNDLLCRGCGSCAAACPTGAISPRHFTDRQIEAEIDSYTLEDAPGGGNLRMERNATWPR